jgi:hypothetical protein
MDNKISSNKNDLLLKESNLKKAIEIHSRRIMPHLEKRNKRSISKETEWDQEYYIIYNSYVLEEKEAG